MELAKTESIRLGSEPDVAARSETALIEAAQQKDPEAFEELVRLYERSVLRLATNILRSPEDARDALQPRAAAVGRPRRRPYRSARGTRGGS